MDSMNLLKNIELEEWFSFFFGQILSELIYMLDLYILSSNFLNLKGMN